MAIRKPAARADAAQTEPNDVRARMRQDLLAGRLAPGARLKFGELQGRYDASIATLREALTELAAAGLVVAETNRGYTVAPVSVADLLDITELRVDLECKALTASIQAGDDEWEAKVLAAYHLLGRAEPGVQRERDVEAAHWNARHRRFHDALVSACPSKWILRFRDTLFDQAGRYRALSMKHSSQPGRMDQHRRLMEAVLARNTEAACEAAETHIRDTARTVMESLPDYRAPDRLPSRKRTASRSR